MNFVFFIGVGFVALSALYLLVSVYSASVRREKLEKHWDREHLGAFSEPTERHAYVEEGMRAYRHGIRRRLILLVYVVPTVAIFVIWLVINWN